MVQNPNIAKGCPKNTDRAKVKEQWHEIKTMLNSIGPPTRETEGWMKVWTDLKTSVKNKLIHNGIENRVSGSAGPFRTKILSPLDEAVAGLLQMESVIKPEGLAKDNLCEEYHVEDVNSDDSEKNLNLNRQSNATGMKTTRHSKAIEKETLLQQQLKIQTNLYNDVKNSLSEILRYSRKTFKLQEDHFELKKEKLKLYREDMAKKDMQRTAMLKLRTEEIDLKRRKIEIEETRNSYMKNI